jgi:ABC-type branched-subunit amino acid transport system ATPase component
VDSTENIILKVEDITAGYGSADILRGVFLELMEGEIVSIIGPNGAGKSTLLKAILGFLKPSKGKILLKGENIDKLKPDMIVAKGVSYVPQVQNIFPSLTVQENLEMGAFLRNDNIAVRMQEMFELFPILRERRNQKAGQLSGGQRQLVAMGRALMLDPQVLLLDEPSAGLAPLFVEMIFEKVKDINSSGVSIVLVEQNAIEALTLSHRGYVLATGKNVMDGDAKALLENEEVGRLYLGG